MPPRPKTLAKGSWRSIALSILLHAGIVAAAVYSWFTWKHRPPETATLAIEGTVVDERTLPKNTTPPAAEPAPPEPTPAEPVPVPTPVEEQGPPKPDPAEIERKQEEERQGAEKIEQEKREQQKRDEDRQAQELKEREDAQRRETEKQAAAAKLIEERAAVEKAAADRKAAEKKRADDAAAAKKAADEKARQAQAAELRRSMEAEERANAASNSDEANRWHAAIVQRITRAWIRPPSAQAGVQCSVSVDQVPGGEVTSVRVNGCTGGDDALRESVERAVYNASPLPTPPPGVPFERILELTFAPQ